MQALFSEHWHSVRRLRPSLREGVNVYHRSLRGQHWVLLHDPGSERFHRVTPAAYRVIALMDGTRDLDQVWDAAVLAGGPDGAEVDAISQHELVQLLGHLHSADLLQTQTAPDAAEVLERYKKRKRANLKQSLLNPLSIKIPLFSPDAFLEKQKDFARALIQPWTLLVWLAVVIPAAVLGAMHWSELTMNLSDRLLSAQNLLIAWATYPLIKALHEYAHALVIKAWGGKVREVGIMLIVFMPVPYVDATASYSFSSKWQRALVAAAGILTELFIGALALYLWIAAEPGLARAMAFNAIMIAGVSTVLVNGNPLMRFDGYFVMTDLIEIPNLAMRAQQYWAYLADRYLFGSRAAEPPLGTARERTWLFGYGAIAPFYRVFIALGLALFVAEHYFFAGVLLALAGLWGTLVMPLWKGWQHLRNSPSLGTHHDRATRRVFMIVGGLAVLLMLVPMPYYVTTEAVTRLPEAAYVRAQTDGHVGRVYRRPGSAAEPGQPLLQMGNPQIEAEAARLRGVVDQLSAQLRKDQTEDIAGAQAAQQKLAGANVQLAEAERKLRQQTVLARASGEFVLTDGAELEGRYYRRGEVIGYIVGDYPDTLLATVPQDDIALIESGARAVELRLSRRVGEVMHATIARETPGGSEDLESAALGSEGGGAILVDPQQQGGVKALQRVFNIELKLERPLERQLFGDRAYIRFDLGWKPLMWQWWLRLRQLLLSKLDV